MGWVVGSIYGIAMLIVGFVLADHEWVILVNEPETYECSFFDPKEVCQTKEKLKRELLANKHREITIEQQ